MECRPGIGGLMSSALYSGRVISIFLTGKRACINSFSVMNYGMDCIKKSNYNKIIANIIMSHLALQYVSKSTKFESASANCYTHIN